MACNLDCPNVSRMPLRADIVVLQDASGVEVVHERLRLVAGLARLVGGAIVDDRVVQILWRVEVLHDVIYLGTEAISRAIRERVSVLPET